MGYIGDYAFDPQVPAGTWVQPKPIHYLPKQWAWIKREIADFIACGVFECSEDVAYVGGAVFVKG